MKKQINIVHYWGGCPTCITSKWISYLMLINKCTKYGWKNWLVLSDKPNDAALIEPILSAGCEIIYQPRSRSNFDFVSIYRNFKFLQKVKCDIFHCYNDHTSPLIAASLARVPVRIWSKLAMSSYYELGVNPKGLSRLMPSTWITCFLSHRILAISDIAGKEIYHQVGFQHKINTVYVPVSLELFSSASAEGIRCELNIHDNDILITSVGHSVAVKGWDIAIKAFVKVYKEVPNAKLLLVGKKNNIEFYNKICKQIQQSGLEGKVLFTGSRTDIPKILKASDVFILPSRSEGTPAALIEAMAVGLPCIATEIGGIPEVIIDGENGLLFQREDSEELAEKIINVTCNSKLELQLIKMAKQNLQRFSVTNYVDSVFSHYQELLK